MVQERRAVTEPKEEEVVARDLSKFVVQAADEYSAPVV